MFNPQMFQQQAANMNPDMLRNASQMFNNMSDEQIKQYASMTGMGNINPSLIRNSASMMSGMKNEDIQNMTKMAANKYSAAPPQAQQQPQKQPETQDNFPQVNRLKALGNDEFKKQNYEQASAKYFESIMEIEEIWATASYLNNDESRKKELITLETQCRLNYCNAKAKLNDFQVVLTQAQKVLQKEQNWKAYFRLGQAQLQLKKYQNALTNLQEAHKMMPTDTTIKQLLEEVKEKLEQEGTQKQQIPVQQKEPEETVKNEEKPQPEEQKVEPQPKKENKFISDEGPKKTRKAQKLESVDVSSEEFQKKKEQVLRQQQEVFEEKQQPEQKSTSEGIVTEEKEEKKTQPPPQNNVPVPPPFIPNIDDQKLQQGMEQFKNMSPEQMQSMTQMMKSMDKGFLRQMMQQQTGMEISESQVEMMQNMISPEMLQTVKNMDPQQLEEVKKRSSKPTTSTNFEKQDEQKPNVQENLQTPPPQQTQPSLSMDPAMIKMLFEQLKQNPLMLKSMVGMFGPNHPVAGYINRASAADLARLVSFLYILLKFVLFFISVYKAVQKYAVAIIVLLIAYIIFR